MANHSILLKKTEEDRLRELYQTKCDEVSWLLLMSVKRGCMDFT